MIRKGHHLSREMLGDTNYWITAGVAIGGALLSYYGQQQAGEQAERGSERAGDIAFAELDESSRQYDQAREDAEPWRQAGSAALEGLAGGISDLSDYSFEFDPSSVGESEAYQFRVSEGARASERAIARAGGSVSGGRIASMMDYGQRMGSQEYEAEFSRQMQTSLTNYGFRSDHLNRLAGVAGVGQAANSTMAGLAGQLATSRASVAGGAMNAAQGAGDRQAGATLGMMNSGLGLMSDLYSGYGGGGGGGDWFSGGGVGNGGDPNFHGAT